MLAAVVVILGRPLTSPLIICTLVVALLVLAVLGQVRRPPLVVVVEECDDAVVDGRS